MFPLYDSSPRRSFPFVNYFLIIVNIGVFLLQLSAPSFEEFVVRYAFIPSEFSLFSPNSYMMVLTSIFLHGSIIHIASNLWFLHIFGDNIEDSFGHFKYGLFYLAAGIVATLSQYMTDSASLIPLIGASGAISGVTGAYFIWFRDARIRSILTLGYFVRIIDIPAVIFLGLWFVIQLFSGFSTFALTSTEGGGTAWFAHIGGFVFGLFIAMLLGKRGR